MGMRDDGMYVSEIGFSLSLALVMSMKALGEAKRQEVEPAQIKFIANPIQGNRGSQTRFVRVEGLAFGQGSLLPFVAECSMMEVMTFWTPVGVNISVMDGPKRCFGFDNKRELVPDSVPICA